MWTLLIPILAEIGAPILKKIISKELPGAEDLANPVIDMIAGKLGIEKTPEAIADAYKNDPDGTKVAVQEVETVFSTNWQEKAQETQKQLFGNEDARSFFSWGWRPAMSWFQLWLWGWNTTLMPLVNAAFHASLPLIPYDMLIAFSSIWLVIYGGGHTVKSVFGK